jgi:transaldolase
MHLVFSVSRVWQMNEDAMATQKLAEGIRNFTGDQIILEGLLSN